MFLPLLLNWALAKGFDYMLQDRGGLGHEKLMEARLQLMGMAAQDKRLTAVRPNGMADVAQYKVDIDWEKAGALGVPVSAVQNAISAAFGSAYVNDFIQGGRVKRVYVQADAPYRMLPGDMDRFYVRNNAGQDGSHLRPCIRALVLRLSSARAVQRFPGAEFPGRACARQEFRRGDERYGRAYRETAQGHRP